MKNMYKLSIIMALLVILGSCQKDKNNVTPIDKIFPPRVEDFAKIRNDALQKRMQKFRISVGNNMEMTSESGVSIRLNQYALKINGEPVSGEIDVEFLELYDSGNMLVTNKRTMGQHPNGDRSLIITGGAFYINASQDGVPLDRETQISLEVPGELTGGVDEEMILWDGELDEDGNLTWIPMDVENPEVGKRNGLGFEGTSYYAFFADFGWTNIDKFYNDPRPKTELWVKAPEGFNGKNSAIYLKYKGEGNALASLDVFDTEKQLFTEHYGPIPIGIECHLIFATESEGMWRVGVKSLTIEEDKVYEFVGSDTNLMSESDLVNLINELP